MQEKELGDGTGGHFSWGKKVLSGGFSFAIYGCGEEEQEGEEGVSGNWPSAGWRDMRILGRGFHRDGVYVSVIDMMIFGQMSLH